MKTRVTLDYILVCEDIRQEVGRKPSAMGIFTDNIYVKDFPIFFPKLCFLVHLNVVGGAGPFRLDAEFRYNDKCVKTLVKDRQIKVLKGSTGLILNFIITPFTSQTPGEGQLIVRLDGKTHRRKFSVSKPKDASVFER